MRWPVSKVSVSPIDGLTQPKQVATEELVEAAKQAIKEICYMRWIEGND